ncbi:hypothetical protein EVAR_42952_1 [Eumeta japonica]|uniref:Uncharacterized protein n=1 Tax=Eumeta variegata TaxID=151549 RepID=A0A4C1YFG5_EUMVA|nr:hypothetical protein EVAR_42952_1 [Eumeta japonica]
MLRLFAKTTGRVGRILQSCRRFETLDVRCGLVAEIDIKMARSRPDNSNLDAIGSSCGTQGGFDTHQHGYEKQYKMIICIATNVPDIQ